MTAGLVSATPAVEHNVLVLVDFSGSMDLRSTPRRLTARRGVESAPTAAPPPAPPA